MEESTAGEDGSRGERVVHADGRRHVQEARLVRAPLNAQAHAGLQVTSRPEHTQVPAGTQITALLSTLPAPQRG